MNNQELKIKLSFNHPVKEIYPGIGTDEIEYILEKISNETDYKSGTIPRDIFSKYYADYLKNKIRHEGRK